MRKCWIWTLCGTKSAQHRAGAIRNSSDLFFGHLTLQIKALYTERANLYSVDVLGRSLVYWSLFSDSTSSLLYLTISHLCLFVLLHGQARWRDLRGSALGYNIILYRIILYYIILYYIILELELELNNIV